MTTTAHDNPPDTERPPLRRSRDDRMIFGVCGGLGRHLGIDPVVVRVAFVLLAVFGGSGVVLYLIGLVVIPPQALGEDVPAGGATVVSAPAVIIGAALVALGAMTLAGRLLPAFGDLLGPLVLICVGVAVILVGRR